MGIILGGLSIMSNAELLKSPVWDQFQTVARRQRRDPRKLLLAYMLEYLEIWEDEQLDQEIQADARRSGYTEDEAVQLVKQLRREKAARRTTGKNGRKRSEDN